jgi:Na+/H+ antiporter NhaA
MPAARDPTGRLSSRPPAPPEVWRPAQRLAASLVNPIERSLHIQAASGVVLLVAAVAALVWANSPWGHLYERLWQAPVTIGVGSFTLAHSIRFWINDGLMVVFFFVVGLEIRREIHEGELSEPRRAALPVAAALGGMLMPALIYLLLNPERSARIWVGMLQGGIHPTIAGVLLGLLTPVRPWFGAQGFLSTAQAVIERIRHQVDRGHDARELVEPLADLGEARREALPPVVRIQAALHPWVAFGVMPLFALANAGVNVRDVNLGGPDSTPLLLGIVAGLVVGKPVGILLASFAAIRLGVAAVPPGMTWTGIALVGCVAGIGFTMAIFVASLAFADAGRLGVATLGVLAASAVAAVVGLVVGRVLLRATRVED